MPRSRPTKEELRTQIQAATASRYSAEEIEERIAVSLVEQGRFEGEITGAELEVILRNVAYMMFAQQRFIGRDVGLIHNIPTMDVSINNNQANVNFIVHIHRPIVAFIKFSYVLINDPVSVMRKLRVKRGSLLIKEHTRRFDIKAKAALATINVESLAQKELSNLTDILLQTLPEQLNHHGIAGSLKQVELALNDHHLSVYLEGDFRRITAG